MPNAKPLDGALVLDLADEPLLVTGRYLADLGARVIRVEAAGGDATRARGPFVDGEAGPERGLPHLLYNAGKQSLALDLESDAAWGRIGAIAEAADVVIAPVEKSDRARALLDALEAVEDGPAVIDAVLRRGQPDLAVSDLAAAAAGGLLYCCGFPDVPPDYPAGKLGYKQASYVGVAAACAAIFDRRLRGRRNRAEISLQEATASTTIQAANQNIWRWWGSVCERAGELGLENRALGTGFNSWKTGNTGTVTLIKSYGTTFATKDGQWVAFMPNPVRWALFSEWYREVMGEGYGMGTAEWHDPMFRAAHREEMNQYFIEFCAALDRDELVRRGQEGRHYATPVQTAADIASDPHLHARDFFPAVEHPALGRAIPKPRSPYRFSGFDVEARPAPGVGEHSEAVLRALDEGSLGARPGTARGRAGDLPLSGYRVLDFCWMAAGPLITELLANLGADVVKIESATGIDQVREFVHPPKGFGIDTGGFFADCNTNKRSLTLNLHKPETVAFIKRHLLPRFDLVTSNYAPDAMSKWGLGPEHLLPLRPDLVIGSFPVMGHSGPKSHWRAIGNGVLALSGVPGHMGEPDRPPVGMGTLHTDFTLAPIAAAGLIAALLQREETGKGQFLEIAQYEASVHLLDTELIDQLVNGVTAARRGNASADAVPHGIYPTAGDDRWVAISARGDAQWRALCDVMGRDDLASRSDLAGVEGRRGAEAEINAAIAAWTSDGDEWEIAERLQARCVPASALESVADQVERDAGLRDYYLSYDRGEVPFLAHKQPFTWNGAYLPTRPSPALGEHNLEILQGELGLDDETLAQLVIDEIVC